MAPRCAYGAVSTCDPIDRQRQKCLRNKATSACPFVLGKLGTSPRKYAYKFDLFDHKLELGGSNPKDSGRTNHSARL